MLHLYSNLDTASAAGGTMHCNMHSARGSTGCARVSARVLVAESVLHVLIVSGEGSAISSATYSASVAGVLQSAPFFG